MMLRGMKIGIFLLNWAIGGSEKRFANLFHYLKDHGKFNYVLITNHYLQHELQEAGISVGNDSLHYLLNSKLGRLIDHPDPDSRKIFGFKIPGFNFIGAKIYEQLRSGMLMVEKNITGLNLSVIHYVFPFYGEHIKFPGGKVLSCQDTRLETTLLKNRFFMNALKDNSYFDIASERIKSILTTATGIQDDHRLRVNPCSFINYSRTYISDKEPIVAFVGNFLPVKNPTLFVEVIERVHAQYPFFRALMYGKGPLESIVKRMISERGLQNVIQVNYNPHPEELLSRALVFMSIQSMDNYHSQALMEAMACGCSIVASDVGETYRLVSENVGFREPLDADALSEKVVWLLKHPDAAAAMGKEARKKVMSEQTVERFGAYIEKLYQDAA